MSTALEARPPIEGAQVDLIRRTIAAAASDTELELFIGLANRTGLDPFAKQIFLVPRRANVGGQWVTTHQAMVSIDGARLVAQRSGKYRGQLAPQWCGKKGIWLDAWLASEPPAAARVAVIHADYPETPTWGVARYDSYVQTTGKDGAPNATWFRMPDVMLAKCAEMLALRKAFQQDLGGLIIEEESGSDPVVLEAGAPHQTVSTEPMPRVKASRDEAAKVSDARRVAGLTSAELTRILDEHGNGKEPFYSDQVPGIIAAIDAARLDDIAAVAEEVPADQMEIDQ